MPPCCSEAEYRATATDFFRKITGTWKRIEPLFESEPYRKLLQGFADACRGDSSGLISGAEGRKSLLIGNAIYLSSWEKRMVDLPTPGSAEERDFESLFERHLAEKRKHL